MSTVIFTNAKILLAGYDLSADHNRVGLEYGAEPKDVTTFGDTTRRYAAGLAATRVSGRGFWEGGADKVDEVLFSRIGLTDELLTLFADTIVEGSLNEKGFASLVALARYRPGERIGEVLSFEVDAESKERLVRAIALKNALTTPVTGAGFGTPFNLGTVPSGQKFYAGLHVIEVTGTGPQLTLNIESDDASGFTTPSLRWSSAAIFGRSAAWASPLGGPITDTWWRAKWSLSVGGPSAKFLIWMAIH